MWNLVQKQKQKEMNTPRFDEVNYYELSNEKRLEILLSTLSTEFEIYIRGSKNIVEEIMIYNCEYKDFIHEDGFEECNLIVFWKECIVPMIEETHENRILLPT